MIALLAQSTLPSVSPALSESVAGALAAGGTTTVGHVTRMSLFHDYLSVFVVAFLVTLFATPLMRRIALQMGIVDAPSESRKVHRVPVAYLGGVAVYLGLLAAIFFSYTAGTHDLLSFHDTKHVDNSLMGGAVPLSILGGITLIMAIGLLDDVAGLDPRLKISGQLVAAAALAMEDVGTNLARGIINPLGEAVGLPTITHTTSTGTVEHIGWLIELGNQTIPVDVVYWAGTAIIALFVLGSCNASNLIDGLDGLLTGTTAIMAAGLLMIAFTLAIADDGPRDCWAHAWASCLTTSTPQPSSSETAARCSWATSPSSSSCRWATRARRTWSSQASSSTAYPSSTPPSPSSDARSQAKASPRQTINTSTTCSSAPWASREPC